jgi:hypothetical protein
LSPSPSTSPSSGEPPRVKAALAARPELYPIVFAQLQALTGEHLIKEGRVNAGGLHKMEPKELANLLWYLIAGAILLSGAPIPSVL